MEDIKIKSDNKNREDGFAVLNEEYTETDELNNQDNQNNHNEKKYQR